MSDTFHWLHVERIGEELADRNPEMDPYGIGFMELRTMVEGLEGFEPDPDHPVNERILEAIQHHWAQEVDDIELDEDRD